MGDPVVHFEINTPDRDGEGKFYSELFGWDAQSMAEMDYVVVDTHGGSGINGGLSTTDDGSSYSTIYVEVSDLDATLKEVEKLGGKTLVPPMEIPNVVTFAMFTDPDGTRVGLVKGGDEGPGVSLGPNPPVGWFEIYVTDFEKGIAFYSKLFGWTFSKSEGEGFKYAEIKEQPSRGISGAVTSTGHGQTGIMLWTEVDDLEKYVERAESLGGKTMMPPGEVQPNLRIAVFTDPQGLPFGVYKRT